MVLIQVTTSHRQQIYSGIKLIKLVLVICYHYYLFYFVLILEKCYRFSFLTLQLIVHNNNIQNEAHLVFAAQVFYLLVGFI